MGVLVGADGGEAWTGRAFPRSGARPGAIVRGQKVRRRRPRHSLVKRGELKACSGAGSRRQGSPVTRWSRLGDLSSVALLSGSGSSRDDEAGDGR